MQIKYFSGAGSGIGRAACRLLNRDGAIIVAADKNHDAVKEVVNALNGDNHSVDLDVASKKSVYNCMQSILSKFSAPPSIVVNAAGILRDNFILKLDEDDFDEVIDVNLKVFDMILVFFFVLIPNSLVHFQIGNVSCDAKLC